MNLTPLLPYTCLLCDSVSDQLKDLCKHCESRLPYLQPPFCNQCSIPLTNQSSYKILCGKCLKKKSFYTQTIALFVYKKPIDYMISALKFNKNLAFARLLSSLLIEKLKYRYADTIWPEAIFPIPLHKKRLQERGFNQSVEIGKFLHKSLHIPLDLYSTARTRNTEAQSLLSLKNRQSNIKNAFKIIQKPSFQYVAILDDVMTTGETVEAFAKVLRKSGVLNIDVWCLARAKENHEPLVLSN